MNGADVGGGRCAGGADKVVSLWDLRNLSKKLHEFQGHTNEIIQVPT